MQINWDMPFGPVKIGTLYASSRNSWVLIQTEVTESGDSSLRSRPKYCASSSNARVKYDSTLSKKISAYRYLHLLLQHVGTIPDSM